MVNGEAVDYLGPKIEETTRPVTLRTMLSHRTGPLCIRIMALALLASVPIAQPAWSQRSKTPDIAPVRVGDQVEVEWVSTWYPGQVVSYANGVANVTYQWNRLERTGEFKLDEMRFPNGEGHWMVWSDASGKFNIEARYISRTATHVTIRSAEGRDITVAIEQLNPRLRRELAKTPITGEENKIDGAVPVRVGDRIQVKSFSDWYDGTVLKVTREGAQVKYQYGTFGDREGEFKFSEMRFPNGEGRWREWSDESGNFKIIARFISRDETHVTIRTEAGQDLRVEIARLSTQLRKLLKETPVIARRTDLVEFSIAEGLFQTEAEQPPETFESISVNVSRPVASPNLSQGKVAFTLPAGDSVSAVIPLGGPDQWVAVGTFGSRFADPAPTKLYWVSPSNNRSAEGPTLLADERVLAYSASQARLVTAEVRGVWGVPVRLCTYRIRPGEKNAIAELSWSVPKLPYASSSSGIQVELVGKDRLLMGYGSSVSLWNLTAKSVEYAVNKLQRHRFWVSPDHRHFAVFDSRQSVCLHDTVTGRRIARQSWEGFGLASASFSYDGRYFLVASSGGMKVWSLTESKPVVELPLGGVSVRDDARLSLLPGGWITSGSQFYSVGLKMVVWRYDAQGLALKHQSMVGREMLAIAMAGGRNQPKTVLVGVASVPHKDAIEMMKTIDTDKLMMLRPGSRIRIEATGDTRITNGLRRAARANGWIEDAGADVVLSGSAELGESETRTYRVTQFGHGPGFGNTSEESHTVQPWIQRAGIKYADKSAWSTSSGGVPFFVTASGDSSIGAELNKSSDPKYDLFENLKIPSEILYPRYQQGLGRTWLTPKGFVDELK